MACPGDMSRLLSLTNNPENKESHEQPCQAARRRGGEQCELWRQRHASDESWVYLCPDSTTEASRRARLSYCDVHGREYFLCLIGVVRVACPWANAHRDLRPLGRFKGRHDTVGSFLLVFLFF